MSNLQQFKISQKIVNLGEQIKNLSKTNQNQQSGKHNISIKFFKDRDDFENRIKIALCSDGSTHTQNNRVLKRNILNIQFDNALSNVVSEIMKRQIIQKLFI